MSFTCRHWTKFFIPFIVIQAIVLPGNNEALNKLSTKISNSNWSRIDCKVVQVQGNDSWADQVNISSYRQDEYEIVAGDQIIQVKQDTVWTYLTKSKQLTIDRFYRDVPNVFYFLNGDFAGLEILGTEISGNLTKLDFKDVLSGYSGNIELNNTTFLPSKLIIELDSASRIVVTIKSFNIDNGNAPEFFIIDDGWEIIDLRE